MKVHVFDLLLSKACDLSELNAASNITLHLACAGGSEHIGGYVITSGIADVESKDGNVISFMQLLGKILAPSIKAPQIAVHSFCPCGTQATNDCGFESRPQLCS